MATTKACTLTQHLTTDLLQYWARFLDGHDLGRLQQGSRELHSLCWDQLINSLGNIFLLSQAHNLGFTNVSTPCPPMIHKISHQITSLYVHGLDLDTFDHCKMEKLHTLILQSVTYTPLHHLQNLRTLVLDKMGFGGTNNSLHTVIQYTLSGLTNLTHLQIDHVLHIENLIHLRQLTHLQITSVSDGFISLAKFPHLVSLSLPVPHNHMVEGCNLTEDFLIMTRLTSLNYQAGPDNPRATALSSLQVLTRLTELSVHQCSFTLEQLTNLAKLTLTHSSHKELSWLTSLTNLVSLSITQQCAEDPYISSPVLPYLRADSLQDLWFSPDPQEADWEVLPNFSQLRSLGVGTHRLDGTASVCTSETHSLIEIHTRSLIEASKNFTNLTSLDMSYLVLDLPLLTKLQKLTCLQLTDPQFQEICENCTNINHLIISHSDLLTLPCLQQNSNKLKKLRQLEIRGCHVGSTFFAPCFEENFNLKKLIVQAQKTLLDPNNRSSLQKSCPGIRYEEIPDWEYEIEAFQYDHGGEYADYEDHYEYQPEYECTMYSQYEGEYEAYGEEALQEYDPDQKMF